MLAKLNAKLQLLPPELQDRGLWHLGCGTIQMQRHMAKDETIFVILVSEHKHELSFFFLFGNIEVSQWCLFIQNNPILQWTEFCNYHNAPAGSADRAGVSVRAVAGIAAASVLGREERNCTL